MAVPIDLLNNSEPSSDDDFSDSEISDSWEDERSESEITNGRETETNRNEEDEFWVKYSYVKNFVSTAVAQGLIPEYDAYERAKLIGDEKAKELNEKGKALFLKELEMCKEMCEIIVYIINALKSVL